jgi:[NiFe] hydrogenase assembly HybE family chaperone
MQTLIARLETVFRRIEQERMWDVPVCNSALQVQAIGFQAWGDAYLGILLTPWFMNLMLFPATADTLAGLPDGAKQMHILPSGRYEFITGRKPELGVYQTCALFSPMQDFPDQQTAVATAMHAMTAIMEPGNRDSDAPALQAGFIDPIAEAQQRLPNMPMSRRDFLRGGRRDENR